MKKKTYWTVLLGSVFIGQLLLAQGFEDEADEALRSGSSRTGARVIQKQPVTYIEANPVVDSRAEQIRKSRQDAEINTEMKIVEKLEESRLEDEKRRANVLFGDKFNQLQGNNSGSAVAPAPQVIIQEVAPPIRANTDVEDVDSGRSKISKEEIKEALLEAEDEKAALRISEQSELSDSYFSLGAGLTDFADAQNVQGNGSLGIGLGSRYRENLLAEAQFIYSSFSKEFPEPTDIYQYTAAGSMKYQMLKGVLRPVVGAVLAFNYRVFSDTYRYSSSKATSNSIDWGLLAGADFVLDESMSIGIEYRQMWNLTNRTNGTYAALIYGERPLDELGYSTLSVLGRFTF